MSDSEVIFAIIAAVVSLFVWGRLPVMLVALLVPLALFFSGILPLDQVFSGFGDTVIVFIAGLFIVAAGLEASGVTAWVGQWLSRVVGSSPIRLSLFTLLIVALLSPLISQSGAVAALVPVVILLAMRMGKSPSQFLMPLAFASAAGSKLALTGTAKNVLISDASSDAGYGSFGFFEFAWVGVPLLAGTVLIVALFGRRLLPERKPANLPEDFGQHARTLTEQYAMGGSARLCCVLEGSPLLGRSREAIAPGSGVSLIAVAGVAPDKEESRTFATGDVLVLRGSPESVSRFAEANRLGVMPEAEGSVADMLFNRHSGLAEVVVKPRSKLIGTVMAPGTLTESGQLVVVAIQRNGEDLGLAGMEEVAGSAGIALQAGDHLLLQGTWRALDRIGHDPDVLAVDSPDAVRRQAVPLGPGSTIMLVILAAMVVVLATGILPASVGVLLAAMAVIASGILTVPQAYRAIDWNTVVLVGSMIPLSTAMYRSGVATQMADLLVSAIGDLGPTMLLAGLFLFTAILGQVISNTATAMIVIPIAVAAAGELGLSAKPVLMSLNVGASAAFLTPVATTSNLIVMGPGGYRFGDYWKLGLVLMALYFIIAVFWVPVVWRL
ncbi:SLC13 family permease [Aestuariivirga sp.]|uniref:SLC13 family permease n=1 Tax=Aestuariivirga sp. TaxID=2650926 RepID=UPI00391DD137